jgi:hypothetical protein
MKVAGEEIIMAVVRRVAPKFFEEGHERVYVATCCGRVLVTVEEVGRCRTCHKRPEGEWLTESDLSDAPA